MVDFTEKLITEVELRPGLYNMALPEYSDSNVKLKLWEEVCKEVIPTWNDMDSKEKTIKGKEVQKRWKSLKDCFRREVALQKKTPSGSGSNKRRKYLYFDQLKFLSTTLGQRKTASSLAPSGDGSEIEETSQTPEPCDYEQSKSQSTPSARKIINKRENSSFETKILTILENKVSQPEDVDDDKHFLLSLLPLMKKFDDNSKLLARVEIMNAIRKVQNDVQQSQHLYQHHYQAPKHVVERYFDPQQNLLQMPQHSNSWQRQSTSSYPHSSTPLSLPSPSASELSLDNTDNTENLYDLG